MSRFGGTVSRAHGLGVLLACFAVLFSTAITPVRSQAEETAHFDIWNPTIKKGPADSSYGYSVSLHAFRDRKYAVIGAPQAAGTFRIPGVTTPGAVYQCTLQWETASALSCGELRIDTQPEQVQGGVKVEVKSYMRLGASVMSQGADGKLVACAPAYKRPFFHPITTNFPRGQYLDDAIGRCYILPADLSTRTITTFTPCQPLPTEKNPMSYLNSWLRYCLTGTSLDIQGSSLAASAPGRELGVGMIWYGDLRTAAVLPRTSGLFSINDVNYYTGLAVVQGDFNLDGSMDQAASQPLYGTGKEGSVIITTAKGTAVPGADRFDRDRLKTNMLRLTGSKNSENFGYSMAAVDINGDGIVELLVGAPLSPATNPSRTVYEIGRVYVFNGTRLRDWINSGPKEIKAAKENSIGLIGEAQSWFGAAISSLGDINDDTYNDVAIGAPFETVDDSPQGAVYIYLGGANGIREHYIQRISPDELLGNTRFEGLGFSLGRGLDYDGNGYNDLIIGSPFSDHAVVLRARPTITAGFTVKKLGQGARNCQYEGTTVRCVDFSVCGVVKTGSLRLGRATYDVQLRSSSIFTFDARNDNIDETTVTMELHEKPRGVEECMQYSAYLTASQQCSSGEVSVVDWSLQAENSTVQQLTAVQNLPPPPTTTSTVQVDVVKACLTCTANLAVPTASLTGLAGEKPLVAGKNQQVLLRTEVVNRGTKEVCTGSVTVFLGQHLSFGSLRDAGIRRCQEDTVQRRVTCTLPPGQPQDVPVVYQFILNVNPNLATSVSSISAGVGAVPDSTRDAVESLSSSVDVVREASIEVTVSSTSSQLELKKEVPSNPEISDLGPELRHEFNVGNAGPSHVPSSFVLIEWPFKLKSGSDFLYLTSITSSDERTMCNATSLINYLSLRHSTPLPERVASLPGAAQITSDDARTRIMCGDIVCTSKLLCKIPDMKAGVTTIVSLTWRVYSDLTEDDRLEFPIVANSTIRLVNISVETGFVPLEPNHPQGMTGTKLYAIFDAPPQSVKWWVILLAVLAGVIILALCILILCKCGFFKRKRAPE